MVMEMFLICVVQHGSHWLNVAIERSKCGYCKSEPYFKFYFILINLNVNGHMWVVATLLESAGVSSI